MNLIDRLKETSSFLHPFNSSGAQVAVILGSGLGNFINELKVEKEIPYDHIPHFPVSTVEGHHGKLIFGWISNTPVIAMSGRFHFYEGYSPEEVSYPVRVLKFLGVQTLFISNAAGGVNRDFKVGDLMIITDHISLAIKNPLLGK